MDTKFTEEVHVNIRYAAARCSDHNLERLQDALSILAISVGCFRRRNRTKDCAESYLVHERHAFRELKTAIKILEEI